MYDYIKLEDAKKHLNIDEDFHDDDNYINSLIEACTCMVEKHIGYDLAEKCIDSGTLPPNIKHAILLLIGNFYAQRESISNALMYELPLSYNYLLQLEKNYNYS